MDRELLRLRRAFVYVFVLASAILALWAATWMCRYVERKFFQGTRSIGP